MRSVTKTTPAAPLWGAAPVSSRRFKSLSDFGSAVQAAAAAAEDFDMMSDSQIKERIALAKRRLAAQREEREAQWLSRMNAADRRERDWAPVERLYGTPSPSQHDGRERESNPYDGTSHSNFTR